jgi:hypothetical protein
MCVEGFGERHSERRDGELGVETTEEILIEKRKGEEAREKRKKITCKLSKGLLIYGFVRREFP